MPLADAINPTNALLHPHGIPGHVAVDQGAAELEVETFGGGIGAEKNRHSSIHW